MPHLGTTVTKKMKLKLKLSLDPGFCKKTSDLEVDQHKKEKERKEKKEKKRE